MAFDFPTIGDFKTYFIRDFPYSSDRNAGVTDQDIANAYVINNFNWQPAFFSTQENYTTGYLYLSAHYLCLSLRMASQGFNGQYNWTQQSKSVQGVAEGFLIPEPLNQNPFYQQLTKTNYGALFFSLVYPQTIAPGFLAVGSTRP